MRKPPLRVALAFLAMLIAAASTPPLGSNATSDVAAPGARRIAPSRLGRADRVGFARLAVRFEPNAGQLDSQVRFTARTRGTAAFFTDGAAVLELCGARPDATDRADRMPAETAGGTSGAPASAVARLRFTGAEPAPRIVGLDPLPGVTNYLLGDDPAKWRTNVPGFAKIKYESLYPGIDAIFYGNDGNVEYDFVCAPGADPGCIRLAVDGAERLEVDASGDLVLHTAAGELRQRAPRVYQTAGGARHLVGGRYLLTGNGEIAFALGAYDASLALIIDPELVYATYLGGNEETFVFPAEGASGIAADADGCAYVVGNTSAPDFPLAHPLQGQIGGRGDQDAFVAKLAPDGASLMYATYLGGAFSDRGLAIALDAVGAVHIAGTTNSTNFPKMNPLQGSLAGGHDLFVAKLAPDGASLLYSTYLGGGADDTPKDLELDATGGAFLTGETNSTDLPVLNGPQLVYGGGESDGFLALIDAGGTELLASTYLGGSGMDRLNTATLRPPNSIYVSGATDSSDFVGGEGRSAFVARFETVEQDARGSGSGGRIALIVPDRTRVADPFPTASSGSGEQLGYKRDDAGEVEFFTAVGLGVSGGVDVLVYGFDRNLATRMSASFGGNGSDFPYGAARDTRGAHYIAGVTRSEHLPTLDAIQSQYAGQQDAFVVVFAPGPSAVAFATYIGGAMADSVTGLAVDPQGNIYVSGHTHSSDLPVTSGVIGPSLRAFIDPFVVKISPVEFRPDYGISADPTVFDAAPREKLTIVVSVDRVAGFDGPVTVVPPDLRSVKAKVKPARATTTGNSVTFTLKVKKQAQPGQHTFFFTAEDAAGRQRRAMAILKIR